MSLDWREVARQVVAKREALKEKDSAGVTEALQSRRYLIDRSHTKPLGVENPSSSNVVAEQFDIRVAACMSTTTFHVSVNDVGRDEPDWTHFLFQNEGGGGSNTDSTPEIELPIYNYGNVEATSTSSSSTRQSSMSTFKPVHLQNYNKLREKRKSKSISEPTVSIEQKAEASSSGSRKSVRLAIFVDDIPVGFAMHHSMLNTAQQKELKAVIYMKLKKNVSKRCRKEFEDMSAAISQFLGSLTPEDSSDVPMEVVPSCEVDPSPQRSITRSERLKRVSYSSSEDITFGTPSLVDSLPTFSQGSADPLSDVHRLSGRPRGGNVPGSSTNTTPKILYPVKSIKTATGSGQRITNRAQYPAGSNMAQFARTPAGTGRPSYQLTKTHRGESLAEVCSADVADPSLSSVGTSLTKLSIGPATKGPVQSVLSHSILTTRELSSPGDSSEDSTSSNKLMDKSKRAKILKRRRPMDSFSTAMSADSDHLAPSSSQMPISSFDMDVKREILSPEQQVSPRTRRGNSRRTGGANTRPQPSTSAGSMSAQQPKRGRGRPSKNAKFSAASLPSTPILISSSTRAPTVGRTVFADQPPADVLFENETSSQVISNTSVKTELRSSFGSPRQELEPHISRNGQPVTDSPSTSLASREPIVISIEDDDEDCPLSDLSPNISNIGSPEVTILQQPSRIDDVQVDNVTVTKEFLSKPERESVVVKLRHSPFTTISTTVSQGKLMVEAADYRICDRIDVDTIPFPTCESCIDLHMFSYLVRILTTNLPKTYNALPHYVDRYDGIPNNLLDLFSEFSPPVIEEKDIDPSKMTDSISSRLSIDGYELLTKKNIPGQLTMHKFISLIEFALERCSAFWDAMKAVIRIKASDMAKAQTQWKDASNSLLYHLCSTLRRMAEATSTCPKANQTDTKQRFEILYYGWRSFVMQGGIVRVFMHLFGQKCNKKVAEAAQKLMKTFDGILLEARSCIRLSVYERVELMAVEYGMTRQEWTEIVADVCDMFSRKFPFECRKCRVWFSTEEFLNRHKFIHSPNGNYTCSVCMCDFRYKLSLSMHFLDRHLDKVLTEKSITM